MDDLPREYSCYILYGRGGLSIIESRLAQHGLCSFTFWDPGPPDWRLRYYTPLQLNELTLLLQDVTAHYSVRIYVDETRVGPA